MSESTLNLKVLKPYEPLWKSGSRYVVIMGGRGAGRSYAVSQYQMANLFQTKNLFRGALMRLVHTDIRKSNYQEFIDRVNEKEASHLLSIADSTMTIENGKNTLTALGFHKSSGDRTAKLKSLAGYTHAFLEEAEEVGDEEFKQLDDSLRAENSQIILTLNTPHVSHWIIKRWFNVIPSEIPKFYKLELKKQYEGEVTYINTNHETNKKLPQAVHERYEKRKQTEPEYYWRQIRGLAPESIQGRIYQGWRELDSVPHNARLLGYGLDFGFSQSKDAIVAVYYHDGGYIFEEKHYALGESYNDLTLKCKTLPPGPIVADSAESRMIAALKEGGVNVIEADKGAGSVERGIRRVQGLRVSYIGKNLKREYENYAWLISKDGENKMVPDPKCDLKYGAHLLDGGRYFIDKMIKVGADPDAEERERVQVEFEEQEEVSNTSSRIGL